jgi:hypothetical protein
MRTPLQRIRDIRGHVRSALDLTKAATLADLTRASESLHNAAAELQSLQTDFRATGIADRDGRFRAEVALLKRDTAAAGRVIDAGAALHRGLALRLAGAATVYSPDGSSGIARPAVTSVEIQG